MQVKAAEDRELYDLLQWTFSNTNAYFRGLQQHAMWLPHAVAKQLVHHSWCMTVLLLQSNMLCKL